MRIGQFCKGLSLIPMSLRYKLMVIFSLMSIIPLLICVYLATNYIFPFRRDIGVVSLVILITTIITLLGFRLARDLVNPIIKMALDARVIASGDIDHKLDVESEDEVGELGQSINMLTRRIKDNMEELHSYGEKTKILNTEIHKRVFALSSLLQVGNMVSEVTELDNILKMVIEKVADLEEKGCAFLMLRHEKTNELVMQAISGIDPGELARLRIAVGSGPLGRVAGKGDTLIIDSKNPPPKDAENLCRDFKVKNLAVFPVTLSGQIIGLLGIGGDSHEGFVFKEEDRDLIRVFIKQIAIAVENDILSKRAKALAVKDELTGLYNEAYLRRHLDEEIKRAITFQRPCSLIIFKVDKFRTFHDAYGEIEAEGILRRIARLLQENAAETDKVARFAGDEFAVLLPERNKKESTRMAEEICRKVGFVFSEEKESARKLTVSGGISENPIDGITAEELIEKAKQGIKAAEGKGGNQVIG